VITATALHKRYGQIVAVDDVSVEAKDGQILGLLGPNGAGKTTTIRMLVGMVRPDRGAVRVDDVDVTRRPDDARARLGVLPDAKGLYDRLTAREHVRYFGQLHGLSGAPLEARIERVLDELDMRAIADRRVQGFSQGERMKVALGRALVHDPPNVLLDEPTNGLDVMTTRAVRELCRSLRAAGRCVILSSHVMQEVAALCDTIAIVSRGRVAVAGTPDELRRQADTTSLEDAFVFFAEGPGAALGATSPRRQGAPQASEGEAP
jgi:sodium transport system ATP-binding protein